MHPMHSGMQGAWAVCNGKASKAGWPSVSVCETSPPIDLGLSMCLGCAWQRQRAS
ncbi:hypothetical protein GQ54DRAFT_300647, partial [Martensiomyces pterosporus]